MTLMVVGSLVMDSTDATQQPQVDSFADLKKCAAKVVRGESQAKYLEYAGDGIIAAIDDINMRHLFRFGSRRLSGNLGISMVAGTGTYTLSSDFFAVREVQLVNSSGEAQRTLEYLPWERYNRLIQEQEETGTPQYWTARNTFDDGTLIIYPTPDAGAVASYKIRVEWYERIARPSEDSDIIDAPRELGKVLCDYAKYHLLVTLDPKDSRWSHFYGMYRMGIKSFLGSSSGSRPRQMYTPTERIGRARGRTKIRYVT